MITQRSDRDIPKFLSRYPGPAFLDADDEDTLELELTPDQMRVLREAAGEWARDEETPAVAPVRTVAPAMLPVTPTPVVVMRAANASPVVAPIVAAPATPIVVPVVTATTPAPIVVAPPPALPREASSITVETFAAPAPVFATPVTPRPAPLASAERTLTTAPSVTATPTPPAPAAKPHGLRSINLTTLLVMIAIASVALAAMGFLSRPVTESNAGPSPASMAPGIDAPVPDAAPQHTTPITPAPANERAPMPVSEPSAPVPVRFKNPFDATEIFEFPPGTSQAEARAAVAATLLERARQRRGMTVNVTEKPRQFEQMTSTTSPRRR